MSSITLPSAITQVCTRCVMDTSDPEITFDELGICNHCKQAEQLLQQKPYALPLPQKKAEWEQLVAKLKEEGKGKQYDCIIGVSGGVDSTYVAYIVKQAGLRPLAVHLDNGWNSELSVMNIENICKKLDIELYTTVLDWDMFKNLQLAFLRSSTPDSEIPTDHAIFATLFALATKYNIKTILTGINIATESILPRTWSYGHWDWKYIKTINKQFGTGGLKGFPHYSILKLGWYIKVKKIKWVSTLNYLEYNKEEAKKLIQEQLGWRDYGGKHHESIYTKFFQTYILPRKFGIDKRKAHLSALICSGQTSRAAALKELEKPIIPEEEVNNDIDYLVKKFRITNEDFNKLMAAPAKTFYDYPNSWNLLSKLNAIRKRSK